MVKRIKIAVIFLVVIFPIVTAQESGGKCGTWRSFERLKNKLLHKVENAATVRPTSHTSILSPNGRFRIHFDTVDVHTPTMVTISGTPIPNTYKQYVDSVAKIFDEVYDIEILQYNYPAPANDGGKGGGIEYDVYIQNLGVPNYGYTWWDDDDILTPNKVNPQFASFMVIDNGFENSGLAEYYTKGIEAVRVTAAHEFHHMIEISASGVWSNDYYFYELCATSIESTVYPEIRDYIQYVRTYYENTNQWPLFLQHSGYERGIFAKFLIERYGPSILNAIWNEAKNFRPVIAMHNALQKYSTSLEREFTEFSIWNYYTNHRAGSTKYFADAGLFPLVKPFITDSLSNSEILVQSGIKSFTIHYNRVLSKQTTIDTIDFIVSNTNYNDAVNYLNQTYFYDIHVSPFLIQNYQFISSNVYARFSASDISNWKFTSTAKGGIVQKFVSTPFPNPFRPIESSLLIPIQNFAADKQNALSIYSASLDLVYSKQATYKSFSGTQYAEWNGRDDKGNIVPTGIYVYVLSRGGESIKGKFAVIR